MKHTKLYSDSFSQNDISIVLCLGGYFVQDTVNKQKLLSSAKQHSPQNVLPQSHSINM